MSRKIYRGGTATKPGFVASGIKGPTNRAKKAANKRAHHDRIRNASARRAGHRK